MSAGVRHVSVRVPWHDRAWDGHVCDAPSANTACLALKLVAEGKDDAVEDAMAGERFDALPLDHTPPCIKASSAFLAPRAHMSESVMAYSRWSDAHKHIEPKALHLPAYGAQLIPYRWMLRESGFEIAEELELDVDPDREPSDPEFLSRTSWIQHHDHQRQLLEAFARPLTPGRSLVLFYSTRTPLCDDERRVLLGGALLETLHGVSEYDYSPTDAAPDLRLRAMVWERAIQHSLRPADVDGLRGWAGGFVMPYQAVLAAAADDPTLDPANYVAFAPEDARVQFSYGSEQVSHGPAVAALLAARDALERVSQVLKGPWASQIDWIDDQISRLWRLQGPAPGLGTALSVLHRGFNGALFAIGLGDRLGAECDPWEAVDAVMSGREPSPAGAPAITSTLSKRWARLKEDTVRFDALKLIARLELTKAQAERAWDMDASDLTANPYSLFEADRDQEEPVAFATIDRGLLPGIEVAAGHPLPASCPADLTEPDNAKRLRAAAVHLLETAADEGHTVLSAPALAQRARDWVLTRPLPLDADLLDIFRDDFSPLIQVGDDPRAPTSQLERYVSHGALIRQAVTVRISKTATIPVDWDARIADRFRSVDPDDDEIAAHLEKAQALERLAASRFAVLCGAAGVGKTTVLKLLLDETAIVGERVLLLAPTGKARVRLGEQTGRAGSAKTIAQYLLGLDRYDVDTGRYFTAPRGAKSDATLCVIDEASMLTEDMLAAVLDTLSPVCRVVLVGDPAQLPPIGAGCPFVDIIAHLLQAKPKAVAELRISMRQRGDRLDTRLAALFSGRALAPGEDEIAELALAGTEDRHLRLRRWDKLADLPALLDSVLREEFGDSDLETAIEFSLGAQRSDKGYLNFHRGCSNHAESWQILTVNRTQLAGSTYLNRLIKSRHRSARLAEAVESSRKPHYWKSVRFPKPQGPEQITYGDKVICVRNHKRGCYITAERERVKDYLANGEIGLAIGQTKYPYGMPRSLDVEFSGRADRSFSFGPSAFKEDGNPVLELAYAVTVHKAQGSQFGVAILVVPENSRLLSREMLYTALTRQMDRIWILHQGGLESLLAYRHEVFSDIAARSTNLFRPSRPQPVSPPAGLSPGAMKNGRGFLEERLTHRTLRGEFVSSKAELVIANILFSLEREGLLTYAVEPSLPFSDVPGGRWADFEVNAGGQTWYWEHCGMLDRPEYKERWSRKRKLYAENGFLEHSLAYPDGRLIVTNDSGGLGLDSQYIDQLARSLFI